MTTTFLHELIYCKNVSGGQHFWARPIIRYNGCYKLNENSTKTIVYSNAKIDLSNTEEALNQNLKISEMQGIADIESQ